MGRFYLLLEESVGEIRAFDQDIQSYLLEFDEKYLAQAYHRAIRINQIRLILSVINDGQMSRVIQKYLAGAVKGKLRAALRLRRILKPPKSNIDRTYHIDLTRHQSRLSLMQKLDDDLEDFLMLYATKNSFSAIRAQFRIIEQTQKELRNLRTNFVGSERTAGEIALTRIIDVSTDRKFVNAMDIYSEILRQNQEPFRNDELLPDGPP